MSFSTRPLVFNSGLVSTKARFCFCFLSFFLESFGERCLGSHFSLFRSYDGHHDLRRSADIYPTFLLFLPRFAFCLPARSDFSFGAKKHKFGCLKIGVRLKRTGSVYATSLRCAGHKLPRTLLVSHRSDRQYYLLLSRRCRFPNQIKKPSFCPGVIPCATCLIEPTQVASDRSTTCAACSFCAKLTMIDALRWCTHQNHFHTVASLASNPTCINTPDH